MSSPENPERFIVFNVNEGHWINQSGGSSWDAMDEAIPTYYPCLFLDTPTYVTPSQPDCSGADSQHDLRTNVGDMTIRDQDGANGITESDHRYYESRWAIAAAWWQAAESPDPAWQEYWHLLLWEALEGLQPPNDPQHRHPRDFFNQLLIQNDDDANPRNGTPHDAWIASAYANHGMNYYPTLTSRDAAGNLQSAFTLGDRICCRGTWYPTNDDVRVYVVANRDNAAWIDGAALADVSGGHEVVHIGGDGEFALTTIWPAANAIGDYDIVVDVNRSGTMDLDFEGILDGCDDFMTIGFTVQAPTPVVWRDVTAEEVSFGVEIRWTLGADVTQGEIQVYRSTDAASRGALLATVTGTPGAPQTYCDETVTPGTTYWYSIAIGETPGEAYGPISVSVAGSGRAEVLSAGPNPIASWGTIRLYLPKKTDVWLEVFSADGRLADIRRYGELGPGLQSISWDTLDQSGRRLETGSYFYSIHLGDAILPGRWTIIR